MKHRLLKETVMILAIGFSAPSFGAGQVLQETPSQATESSNEGRGGGDSYVIDFVRTVRMEIYPLAKKYPERFKASAIALLETADPERMVSNKEVHESCDDSGRGRKVEVCYNPTEDMFHISRTLYPKDVENSRSKQANITHELYRRLRIEGSQYEESGAVNLKDSDEAPVLNPIFSEVQIRGKGNVPETVFLTREFIPVGDSKKARLVLSSYGTVVANAACRVWRQKRGAKTNPLEEVTAAGNAKGKAPILFFVNEPAATNFFDLEDGYNYVFVFQGQAHGLPAVIGAPQKEPFTLSAKLLNETGRTLVDFGDVPVQMRGEIQKPIRGLHNAFETVQGLVNPVNTAINASVYISK